MAGEKRRAIVVNEQGLAILIDANDEGGSGGRRTAGTPFNLNALIETGGKVSMNLPMGTSGSIFLIIEGGKLPTET